MLKCKSFYKPDGTCDQPSCDFHEKRCCAYCDEVQYCGAKCNAIDRVYFNINIRRTAELEIEKLLILGASGFNNVVNISTYRVKNSGTIISITVERDE